MTDQTTPRPRTPGQAAPSPLAPGPTIPTQAAPRETTIQSPAVPRQVPPDTTAHEPVEPGPPRVRRRFLRRTQSRRQSAFRRWRKTRPFWGGVLTMLAGLEIAAITGTTYSLILISKSVTFAITVGAVIFVLGLTMWLSPVVSRLLGLLTLLAALLSFVTSNLGGFLLGMLLAIVGGGLSFAWEPGRTPDAEDAAAVEPVLETIGAGIPRQRIPGPVGDRAGLDPVGD